MKVCILSMQRVNNMGSLLQSYALKKTLNSLNCEVEFLDIQKKDQDYYLLGNVREEYHESERTGFIGKLKKLDRYSLNRIKIKHISYQQDDLFDVFRKNQLNIEKKSSHYDLCVIGSDEVFNCLNSSTWGFTSQLFGNVPEAKQVITYAASCGATKYDNLTIPIRHRISESFDNIAWFSVRDKNTYEFVNKLTSKDVQIHLDPVLIYDFKKELDELSIEYPKKYCIVYSYYNRIHDKHEVETIVKFCEANGLIPIALGAPQYWIKEYIPCTPFECLKLFQNAEFVLTDTFHGTIFAAKYTKAFGVMTRPSNYNKLNDLINRLGIRNHLLKSIDEIDSKLLITKVDISEIIKAERERTLDYLSQYCKE